MRQSWALMRKEWRENRWFLLAGAGDLHRVAVVGGKY